MFDLNVAIAAGRQGKAAAATGRPVSTAITAVLPGGPSFQTGDIDLAIAGNAIMSTRPSVGVHSGDGCDWRRGVHGDQQGCGPAIAVTRLIGQSRGEGVIALCQGGGEVHVHIAVGNIGDGEGDPAVADRIARGSADPGENAAAIRQYQRIAGDYRLSIRGGGVEGNVQRRHRVVGDAIAVRTARVGHTGQTLDHCGTGRDGVQVLALNGGHGGNRGCLTNAGVGRCDVSHGLGTDDRSAAAVGQQAGDGARVCQVHCSTGLARRLNLARQVADDGTRSTAGSHAIGVAGGQSHHGRHLRHRLLGR